MLRRVSCQENNAGRLNYFILCREKTLAFNDELSHYNDCRRKEAKNGRRRSIKRIDQYDEIR